jgi:hypothetical protein
MVFTITSLVSHLKFSENRLITSYTLLRGVNEFTWLISLFFQINEIQYEIYTKILWSISEIRDNRCWKFKLFMWM